MSWKSIGGCVMLAHLGPAWSRVRQWRYALRRHSRSHSGSPFFAEMRRTTSSSSPCGIASDSMSVTKPWRYACPARSRMSLLVSCSVVTSSSPSAGCGDAGASEIEDDARRGVVGDHVGEAHARERVDDHAVELLPAVVDAAAR